MKRLARIAFLISGAALAACGTPLPNPLMGSGHTPDYVVGWNDGCSSGQNSQNPVVGSHTKDQKQYDTNKQYAEGWSSGFAKCSYAQQQKDASGGGR